MKYFFESLITLINGMSPYLLLGFLFAGILHVAVPRVFYRKYLSADNFRSVLYASLFGIPLPLCSCGVIPTAMSLRREGVSRGATTAFLTSTPQTGVDSILATYALMGLPFAVVRPLAALVTSLFAGTMVNKFVKQDNQFDFSEDSCTVERSNNKNGVIVALKYGFVDMLQDIGGHLIVGLIIAGIIAVCVPDSFFLRFADYPLIEMVAILAVSIPMYVCATGSIPVAAALMLKGLSPGAALVFLMAGPVTNFASLLVINKVMGNKTMWIYLISIIVGAVGFGLGIDYLLPSEWFKVDLHNDMHVHGNVPLWKWISTIVFGILLIHAMLLKYFKKDKLHNTMENQTIYEIAGMSCNHCKNSVESNLKKLDGVTDVTVELSSGLVTVTGRVDDEQVRRTIEELGFEYKGHR